MSSMHAAVSIEQAIHPTLMPCTEKTLDYCSCLANYTYVSNGTTYHSDGGCIQDDPDIPPWCIVREELLAAAPQEARRPVLGHLPRCGLQVACLLYVSLA